MNRLIHGDCLEVLKNIEPESVDLIYLDPPFFSNRNYEIIWGDDQETRSFGDRFSGGIYKYIDWLKERVEPMYDILKPTGSIFLHCDYHANAYIRVFILDEVFGRNNFRNEIIWHYDIGNSPRKDFKKKHDTIWRYSKSNRYLFNLQKIEVLNVSRYNLTDADGRKYFVRGDSGKKCYADEGIPCDDVWSFVRENQFRSLNSQSKERIGYPTQKPEALLERIVKSATNEGDVVLDPFCGGGTTLAVANKLNRQWIGIDQSIVAIKVSEARLTKNNLVLKKEFKVAEHTAKIQQGDFFNDFEFLVQLHKYDYETLRNSDAFEFEDFIIRQFNGTPNEKQRSDKGIDGKANDGTPIQVKRSDNIIRDVVDKFVTAAERFNERLFKKNIANNQVCGTIIAFSFSRGCIEEVARLRNKKNIIIDLKRVDEIVNVAMSPQIKLDIIKSEKNVAQQNWEITFKVEINNDQQLSKNLLVFWDFDYQQSNGFTFSVNEKNHKNQQFILEKDKNNEILQSHIFSAGEHSVAVKISDEDGLESIDFLRFHLNGKITHL